MLKMNWIRSLLMLAAWVAGAASAFVPPTAAKRSEALTLLYGIRERFFSRRKKRPVPAPEEITEGQVLDLFYRWNDALGSGHSNMVAKTYASDAVLIPTSVNLPQTGYDSIKDYFERVVKRKPSVTIVDGTITTGHNWATNVGIYNWSFGDDGSQKKARYTFVYAYTEDDEWKIQHHHSSAFPEG